MSEEAFVETGRRTEAAWPAWAPLALVAAGGTSLLALAAAGGAPSWPAWLFAAVAGAALAGLRPAWRRLRALERAGAAGLLGARAGAMAGDTERELAAAFADLKAGDLVRVDERAGRLPPGPAAALAGASRALTAVAEQIQDGSVEVAAAAEGVQETAADLASGSSQQAASVVEITAAMEELARTAAQIAESAALQAELAGRGEASGDAGIEAVDQAVAGVAEMQKRISAISERADALGTRSKEIYRVLDLITEISQETHVLSLNAAIEAAAAGADGRRFAVVAEEVRRLAHRSQDSVDSVRGLLDEFSGSIRATIVATEEGSKEAARVLERSRQAAAAIGELSGASGATARVARQISLATQQQNAASDEVVMTLREVSQVVQRMTGGLKQLADTADRLHQLGLAIQLLAQSFRLRSPRSLKNLVEDWAGRLRGLDTAALEVELDRLVQTTSFIEVAFLVDPRGYTVAFCGNRELLGGRRLQGVEKAREVDMSKRPWYRAVVREERPILTPPYVSFQSGTLCFTVAAPLAGSGDAFAGVLGIDVDVTSWARI